MKIIGRKVLHQKGLNTRLNPWLAEINHANWKIAKEVTSHFPSVIQSESNTFIYPLADMNMAVEFLVAFPQGIVCIKNIIKK